MRSRLRKESSFFFLLKFPKSYLNQKGSYSSMKRAERQLRLYAFLYGDNSQYFLPCKTFTATSCSAFGFLVDTGHFEVLVANASISSLFLKVALKTTPNSPLPSSSSNSICSGRISHLSGGVISSCE